MLTKKLKPSLTILSGLLVISAYSAESAPFCAGPDAERIAKAEFNRVFTTQTNPQLDWSRDVTILQCDARVGEDGKARALNPRLDPMECLIETVVPQNRTVIYLRNSQAPKVLVFPSFSADETHLAASIQSPSPNVLSAQLIESAEDRAEGAPMRSIRILEFQKVSAKNPDIGVLRLGELTLTLNDFQRVQARELDPPLEVSSHRFCRIVKKSQ